MIEEEEAYQVIVGIKKPNPIIPYVQEIAIGKKGKREEEMGKEKRRNEGGKEEEKRRKDKDFLHQQPQCL